MHIQVVNTDALAKIWLHFPIELYKNDSQYIRPLDKDIVDVFDEKKNKFYKQGVCERWLIKDANNILVARIAVFVNKKYKEAQPTGGFGFFECIDDKTVAHFVFDETKKWLQAQGMEAMDGPINFGERDRWWGLLVNGFEEPLYCMNYNLPYYKELFESYGFEVYYNQLCFGLDTTVELDAKFVRIHGMYAKNPDFHVEHIKKNAIEKYAADFCTVYNKAWAKHGGGKQMEIKQAVLLFKKMKPVMDELISWFVYYKNEPIGMWINLPDLNQYFKHMNGQFGLWQKLKFLYYKYTGSCKRFLGIVYGIVPEWQGKGTDAYLIVELAKHVQPTQRYKQFEMQWIGDFNPKMVNLSNNMGATEVRRLSTYRYLFDSTLEFKRHPTL
jgi:hypothetical protein